jgi:isopenicillin N synthase-like dioxygenase
MVSSTSIDLPVINLEPYLKNPHSDEAKVECFKLAEACKKYSAFAVNDPRVTEQENSDFLDLIEDYFNLPTEEKMKDCRPELAYQVGTTPENTELPRCGRDEGCLEMVKNVIKVLI